MGTSKDTENGSKKEKKKPVGGGWGKLNSDNNCVIIFK